MRGNSTYKVYLFPLFLEDSIAEKGSATELTGEKSEINIVSLSRIKSLHSQAPVE